MEFWLIVFFSLCLCLCLLIKAFFNLLFPSPPLPPGPPAIPFIGNSIFLRKSLSQLEPILQNLHSKYGPLVTVTIGSQRTVFISDGSLAHQALVQNGAVVSSRPKALAATNILTSNQFTINSAFYGPTWRLLRRNLTSEMLHTSRLKSFSGIRRRVLEDLLNRLKSDSESGNSVKVIDHLQDAMFNLLVFMCFGEGLNDKLIRDIDNVRRRLLSLRKFNILNFWPRVVSRILFRKLWDELFQMKKEQEDVLIPLIRSRKKAMEEIRKNKTLEEDDDNNRNEVKVPYYLDTLLDLELPEEKRKLDEPEVVTLCFEFLIAGTDTTTTVLQWILANLVKNPSIQQRVVAEIREVMSEREYKEEVKEEELQRLPYLKAVILEGLRRHPPGHFVVPHAVSEDMVLNDYLIPKNGTINVMVAEIGKDPKVWEDPMEFKPERFLKINNNGGDEEEEGFDITGSKEIKMMPFGVGRRICPGSNLAILHLQYFVANVVWSFEWKASNGEVDLSEKQELTVVMKHPLKVYLSPRF